MLIAHGEMEADRVILESDMPHDVLKQEGGEGEEEMLYNQLDENDCLSQSQLQAFPSPFLLNDVPPISPSSTLSPLPKCPSLKGRSSKSTRSFPLVSNSLRRLKRSFQFVFKCFHFSSFGNGSPQGISSNNANSGRKSSISDGTGTSSLSERVMPSSSSLMIMDDGTVDTSIISFGSSSPAPSQASLLLPGMYHSGHRQHDNGTGAHHHGFYPTHHSHHHIYNGVSGNFALNQVVPLQDGQGKKNKGAAAEITGHLNPYRRLPSLPSSTVAASISPGLFPVKNPISTIISPPSTSAAANTSTFSSSLSSSPISSLPHGKSASSASVPNNGNTTSKFIDAANMSNALPHGSFLEEGLSWPSNVPLLPPLSASNPFHVWADPESETALSRQHIPSSPPSLAMPGQPRFRKCLVLDLDETLIHSSFQTVVESADWILDLEIQTTPNNNSSGSPIHSVNQQGVSGCNNGANSYPWKQQNLLSSGSFVEKVYVLKRPHVDEFLSALAQYFEIILFTASLPSYANLVIDLLDPTGNLIHHRLFRDSCVYFRGQYIKDLSLLGRPLDQVVIIDNSPISYMFQPEHAVPISSWYSDKQDFTLQSILQPLIDLSRMDKPLEGLSRVRRALMDPFSLSPATSPSSFLSPPTPSSVPGMISTTSSSSYLSNPIPSFTINHVDEPDVDLSVVDLLGNSDDLLKNLGDPEFKFLEDHHSTFGPFITSSSSPIPTPLSSPSISIPKHTYSSSLGGLITKLPNVMGTQGHSLQQDIALLGGSTQNIHGGVIMGDDSKELDEGEEGFLEGIYLGNFENQRLYEGDDIKEKKSTLNFANHRRQALVSGGVGMVGNEDHQPVVKLEPITDSAMVFSFYH